MKAAKGGGATPAWNGGRMPLSTTLADAMVEAFARAARGDFDAGAAGGAPMLALQERWSALPTPEILLAETLKTREGWHLFVYPFAGRNVHLGLASLVAWRAGQTRARHLLDGRQRLRLRAALRRQRDWGANCPTARARAGAVDALRDQILAQLNAGRTHPPALPRHRPYCRARRRGLSRRAQERAHDAGLVEPVLRRVPKVRPGNGLLRQAEREVLEDELDVGG